MIKRILSVITASALCLTIFSGCSKSSTSNSATVSSTAQRYSTIFYDAFDTITQVIAYCDSEEEFNTQMEALHADLLEYNKLYDIYNDYDGVNLSLIHI